MFSWFRRKQPPKSLVAPPTPAPQAAPPTPDAPAPDAPPDFGTDITIAFSNGQQTWEEHADLLQIATDVLQNHGHAATPYTTATLRLEPSGLLVNPVLRSFQPIHPRGVRTTTTIHVAHPAIGDQEVFEFQHANGDSLEESLRTGLDQWAQVDLPVLLDALAETPAACMLMNMTFPAEGDTPPRARRAVLGPVGHFASATPVTPGAGKPEDHPFCPCCFFTNTFEAFKPQLESTGFHAIRFYAARDANGTPQADCRINGLDHPAGADALRAYVTKWPDAGVEFRKQYVILQNAPPPDTTAPAEPTTDTASSDEHPR